jgi:hypothetical protein
MDSAVLSLAAYQDRQLSESFREQAHASLDQLLDQLEVRWPARTSFHRPVFREFALPYERRVISALQGLRCFIGVHISATRRRSWTPCLAMLRTSMTSTTRPIWLHWPKRAGNSRATGQLRSEVRSTRPAFYVTVPSSRSNRSLAKPSTSWAPMADCS